MPGKAGAPRIYRLTPQTRRQREQNPTPAEEIPEDE
jgi:hypothetical protein